MQLVTKLNFSDKISKENTINNLENSIEIALMKRYRERNDCFIQKKDFFFLNLNFLTSQCCLIEIFILSTWNQPWMSFDTSNQMMFVAGNGEPWEWPESCSWWMRIDFRWAFESNNG